MNSMYRQPASDRRE
uniref:Uncharacterized protein n=1 Tax=Arundo donax TaxID=35708 RepID=A0A0A9BUV7_ARUDO